MKTLRCMSCESHKRDFLLREDTRPVYHDPVIYESSSGALRYCGNCLIHAQLHLTNLLGEATINEVLSSGKNNRLKEFGRPFSRNKRIMWQLDLNRSIPGNPNV